MDKGRVGTFFLFIGLVLWIIFFFTNQAADPSYGYFFVGAAAVFLGGFLWWRNRKPMPESGRFRTINRMRQKRAERKAKKKNKNKEQQTPG